MARRSSSRQTLAHLPPSRGVAASLEARLGLTLAVFGETGPDVDDARREPHVRVVVRGRRRAPVPTLPAVVAALTLEAYSLRGTSADSSSLHSAAAVFDDVVVVVVALLSWTSSAEIAVEESAPSLK